MRTSYKGAYIQLGFRMQGHNLFAQCRFCCRICCLDVKTGKEYRLQVVRA